MKVFHRLEITGICPADQKADVYRCIVEARRVVPVEAIIAAVQTITAKPAFQETICQELHRALACRVTLVGLHSGVETEVTCG